MNKLYLGTLNNNKIKVYECDVLNESENSYTVSCPFSKNRKPTILKSQLGKYENGIVYDTSEELINQELSLRLLSRAKSLMAEATAIQEYVNTIVDLS